MTFKEDTRKLKEFIKAAYDKHKKPGSPEITIESFNIGNLRVYSKNDYKFAKITSVNKEFIDTLL